MIEEPTPSKPAPEEIDCETCRKISRRQGAQDGYDVYRCADGHLTRKKVGWHREHKE